MLNLTCLPVGGLVLVLRPLIRAGMVQVAELGQQADGEDGHAGSDEQHDFEHGRAAPIRE